MPKLYFYYSCQLSAKSTRWFYMHQDKKYYLAHVMKSRRPSRSYGQFTNQQQSVMMNT